MSTDIQQALRFVQAAHAAALDLTDNAAIQGGPAFAFRAPEVPVHTILMPDLMLSRDGRLCVIEVNVANAAGSSAHAADLPRAQHAVDTLLERFRSLKAGDVVLIVHSTDTKATPEIRTRSGLIAAEIEQRTDLPCEVQRGDGHVRDDAVNVVVGPIPGIAEHVEHDGDQLTYARRRVVHVGNPNLLPELVRRGIVRSAADLDLNVFHEGPLSVLGHDKCIQQDLCIGTGFTPLRYEVAPTMDAAASVIAKFCATLGGAVFKPMGTSGGTAVRCFDSKVTLDEIRWALDAASAELATKYGHGWESTCLPGQVFEFCDAMPADTAWGPARWDLRMMALVRPDRITVCPLSARVCPAPIGPRITQDNAVVNITSRRTDGRRILTPTELCERVGTGPDLLEHMATAVDQLTRNAIAHYCFSAPGGRPAA